MKDNINSICCPEFNPELWHEKEIVWTEKLFVKDKYYSILNIPLNIGRVITRDTAIIEQADAKSYLFSVIAEHVSSFKSNLYFSVTKEVPGMEMIKMSGKFLSKVFEGSYSNIGLWIKEMKAYVNKSGYNDMKLFFYYPTCPKCAKERGKNYVVILAKVL